MKKAVSAAVTRHTFAIKVIGKLPGLFGAHRYLYHCARCKWSFIVNDGRRGVLTPIDDHGQTLADDEAVARAATFALGPCPAMAVLTQEHAHVNGANGVPADLERAAQSEPRLHQQLP